MWDQKLYPGSGIKLANFRDENSIAQCLAALEDCHLDETEMFHLVEFPSRGRLQLPKDVYVDPD